MTTYQGLCTPFLSIYTLLLSPPSLPLIRHLSKNHLWFVHPHSEITQSGVSNWAMFSTMQDTPSTLAPERLAQRLYSVNPDMSPV